MVLNRTQAMFSRCEWQYFERLGRWLGGAALRIYTNLRNGSVLSERWMKSIEAGAHYVLCAEMEADS